MVYPISTRDEASSGDRVATEVIKEGDPGDAFFIVRSGEVSGSSPCEHLKLSLGWESVLNSRFYHIDIDFWWSDRVWHNPEFVFTQVLRTKGKRRFMMDFEQFAELPCKINQHAMDSYLSYSIMIDCQPVVFAWWLYVTIIYHFYSILLQWITCFLFLRSELHQFSAWRLGSCSGWWTTGRTSEGRRVSDAVLGWLKTNKSNKSVKKHHVLHLYNDSNLFNIHMMGSNRI